MPPPELCSTHGSALTPAVSLQQELHLTIFSNIHEPMCIPLLWKTGSKISLSFVHSFYHTAAEGSDHPKFIVPFEKGSRLKSTTGFVLESLPCTDGVRLQKGHAVFVALTMPGDLQGDVRCSPVKGGHCSTKGHSGPSLSTHSCQLRSPESQAGLAEWALTATHFPRCPCSVTAMYGCKCWLGLPASISLRQA